MPGMQLGKAIHTKLLPLVPCGHSRILQTISGLVSSAALSHIQHGKPLSTRCALLPAGCRQGQVQCQSLHSHTCSLLNAAQLGVPCWLLVSTVLEG